MTLLELVRSVLDAAQIGHALIGAAALAASGVSRSTFDLDLMAVDRRCLAGDMWEPLRRRGASAEVRRGDASDPLAGVNLDLADLPATAAARWRAFREGR